MKITSLFLVIYVVLVYCKVDVDKYDGIIQPLSEDGYKIISGKASVKILVSVLI
jgi:hypothetical protein